jgi:hypothetical protein
MYIVGAWEAGPASNIPKCGLKATRPLSCAGSKPFNRNAPSAMAKHLHHQRPMGCPGRSGIQRTIGLHGTRALHLEGVLTTLDSKEPGPAVTREGRGSVYIERYMFGVH